MLGLALGAADIVQESGGALVVADWRSDCCHCLLLIACLACSLLLVAHAKVDAAVSLAPAAGLGLTCRCQGVQAAPAVPAGGAWAGGGASHSCGRRHRSGSILFNQSREGA